MLFHDANARRLTAVPLDDHGLDHPGAGPLRTGFDDPTAWVDARGSDFDCSHPRYRQARGVDEAAGPS